MPQATTEKAAISWLEYMFYNSFFSHTSCPDSVTIDVSTVSFPKFRFEFSYKLKLTNSTSS